MNSNVDKLFFPNLHPSVSQLYAHMDRESEVKAWLGMGRLVNVSVGIAVRHLRNAIEDDLS